MPLRWPMAFVQVKAGNRSENLPNQIRQIIRSLYRMKLKLANEITIKVWNNIMNSIKT